MAIIRRDEREIQFKLVYFGPQLGGKTTNLHYVHLRLDPRWRGDMVSVATQQNRTISFEFLPLNTMAIGDFKARFQLYTVPGQTVMKEIRKSVLAGADTVVFVADSAPGRLETNTEALNNCHECLRENRINPSQIPFVFQSNKRDLPEAASPDRLDEVLDVSIESFLASALSGYQIFATLDAVTQRVLREFQRTATAIEGWLASLDARFRHVAVAVAS